MPARCRDPHEVVEQPALRPTGILDTDHHLGEDVFPDPRRGEEIGRTDLVQIVHHRRPRLRTVDAEAGGIGLGEGEDVVADPGHGKVGHDLLILSETIALGRVAGRDDEVVERKDDPLGPSGRSGRVEDDGRVRCFAHGYFVEKETRVLRIVFAAPRLHLREFVQERMVVTAQASRILVDHKPYTRAALLYFQNLVNLFLILQEDIGCFGVVEDVRDLFGHGVLVDRDGDGAQRLGRGHRPYRAAGGCRR